MDVSVQLKWISAVVGVIGLWLIVGPPFLFEAPFADFWSDLIVGFVLLSLAIYTYARRASASSQWAMAAATVFGGWVILGAFLWGTSTILFWNDILAGGVVAVLAGYSTYEARETYGSDGNSSEDSDDSSRNTEGDSGEDSGDGSNGDSNDGSSGSSGDDSSDDESDDSDESDNDSSDGDSSDDGDGDGDSEADSSGGG